MPKEISELQVGARDRQIRFYVVLNAGAHKHASARALKSVSYRIGVYAPSRKKLIKSFEVLGHQLGETLFFVVPSSVLICDREVEIRVDDLDRQDETNEKNNGAQVTLGRPQKGGLDAPSYVPPERCP